MTVFPQGTLIQQSFTNVSCLYKHTTGKQAGLVRSPTRKSIGRGQYLFDYFAGNTASDSFFYYMIDLLRLFQTRSFVLSRKHQNQNVATIGTLLDQFMLSCK